MGLLKAQEIAGKESGLGTPVAQTAIIKTRLTRKYILHEKKNLAPTETGLAVFAMVKHKRIAQAEEIKTYTRTITQELLQSGKGIKAVLARCGIKLLFKQQVA